MTDNPYHPPSKPIGRVDTEETLRKIDNKKKSIKIASSIAIIVVVWIFAFNEVALFGLFGLALAAFCIAQILRFNWQVRKLKQDLTVDANEKAIKSQLP